jgi:beta-glucosidase
MRRCNVLILFLCLSLLPARAQSAASSSSTKVETRVEELLKQLTLEQKIDLIGGVDVFYIRDVKQIGLPRLKMADGPIGVRNYGPSTTFGGIGLAATWDPELIQRMGEVIGDDARARGVHFLLGPGVNIYRAPLCGRNFEYFGEDPFLASRTAVAYIKGLQSKGVSATIKHFIGNNSEYDRNRVDSVMDERTMREIYLPTFEAAVKEAHVGAIMDSYNFTNGRHMTENGYLNNDVVKKEWGFKGIMMSDWDATYDGVAAANGGLDLEMPSGKFMNRATLLPAVKSGKVSQDTIDDKVRRILRTAIEFGWLDWEQTDSTVPLFNVAGRSVALEAARAGMVLLKNENNILPLDKSKIRSVAVIGPGAYPAQYVGGGSAAVKPFVAVSYLEGLVNYLGPAGKVYYHPGIPSLSDMAENSVFSVDRAGREPGLAADVFSNPDFAGKPVRRRDEHVNFDSVVGGGQDGVSVRWSGYVIPSAAGEHMFFVQGPSEIGGYRLYVDDKLVINNWGRADALVREAKQVLQAGEHKIRLEFFVHAGWGKAGIRFGVVRTDSILVREAKQIASQADAVVVAVGFDPDIESEGSDRTFQLPPGQDELIQEIRKANPKTIVAITSGGATDMNAWVDQVPAILQTWYSGQEGGTALSQLLFGEFSPSGKLPVSFERRWEDSAVHDSYYPNGPGKKVIYTEGVFLGYRHFDKAGVKPLFSFGYGLSYTTFGYKNLSVSPAAVSGDQPVTVGFDVVNSGERAGAEVAEVYVGESHAPVPRPAKELKGFSKVFLAPGESKHVSVELDRRAFAYYDVKKHDWTTDPGEFAIYVGSSEMEAQLTGKVTRRDQ